MAELSDHRSCGRHCVVESTEMQFLASISQEEFESYRSHAPDLRDWPSYEDFVLERDGSFLGLSWAGVNAVQVEAPLDAFEKWIERTGAPPCLEVLDDFAMRRWLRASFPTWALRAAPAVVSSAATQPSGYLDIPFHREAPAGGVATDLLSVIARECLDAAV